MRTLILLLQKVEIMLDLLIPTLWTPDRRKRDSHIELAPSLLFDREWRALDDLLHALAERFMQVVGGFFVAGGWQFFAVGADEVDGDFPAAHGEAFHFLRFIAVQVSRVSEGLRVW